MNEYYTNQAGSGIATFTGQRYQKGHGMLGRFFTGSVMPLLKKVLPFLGKQALSVGADFANEWNKGGNFKKAASKSLKRGGLSMAEQALSKFKDLAQEGEGIKRPKLVATTSHINLHATNKMPSKKRKKRKEKAVEKDTKGTKGKKPKKKSKAVKSKKETKPVTPKKKKTKKKSTNKLSSLF